MDGDGWSATIKPDGTIAGNMPKKLVQFLSYNKVEYDETDNEKTTHKVDYVKQGFGEGGHSMAISPIYKDPDQENADEKLKQMLEASGLPPIGQAPVDQHQVAPAIKREDIRDSDFQ